VIDRRTFIGAVAGGFLASPMTAGTQPQARKFRIGILTSASPANPDVAHILGGFFQGMREFGYVEGQNIVVEGRYYGDNVERLPALAAELVQLRVDVIVAGSPPAPEAAKRATATIPIVMINHNDPVSGGLVASLSKPAGNVTGMSMATVALRGKQLQLLKEVVPRLTSVAVIWSPTGVSNELTELAVAARSLNLQLKIVEARIPSEFSAAFAAATKQRVGAVLLYGGAVYFAHQAQLVELAAVSRLPAIYGVKEFVVAGGLMAYGVDLTDSARRAAAYVDKILKGAKPGDLPIEQPTKFELVINLKTAKTLGLTIPQSLLVRADEVIQ
jgi:putative tryptophan/tyrosine transport system substrate-binding protein